MAENANPWQDAAAVARRYDAERAPFYATVVSVATPVIVVDRGDGGGTFECDASTEVITSAVAGDLVWCIPTGGRVFAGHIKAT